MAGGLLRWLCTRPVLRRREARLVLWGGETRTIKPGTEAGEVMMEHAAAGGHVVCRADGFRIGRPAPVLDVEDRLEAGRTYLVVPVDRLPQGRDVITAASLAALSYGKMSSSHSAGVKPSAPTTSLAGGARSPFEYVKEGDGRTVIRVTEEFMVKAVTGGKSRGGDGNGKNEEAGGCGELICSTPELKKHYEQLVGAARNRSWSPRLDTIKERKGRRRVVDLVNPGRCSPVMLLRLS